MLNAQGHKTTAIIKGRFSFEWIIVYYFNEQKKLYSYFLFSEKGSLWDVYWMREEKKKLSVEIYWCKLGSIVVVPVKSS